MKEVSIYIYTEYAGSVSKGSGSYHVIWESMIPTNRGEEPATMKKINIINDITRNKLELMAVHEALSHMTKPSHITIYTTSDYIYSAWEYGWISRWKANDFTSKGKPIKHDALWRKVVHMGKQHESQIVKTDKSTGRTSVCPAKKPQIQGTPGIAVRQLDNLAVIIPFVDSPFDSLVGQDGNLGYLPVPSGVRAQFDAQFVVLVEIGGVRAILEIERNGDIILVFD